VAPLNDHHIRFAASSPPTVDDAPSEPVQFIVGNTTSFSFTPTDQDNDTITVTLNEVPDGANLSTDGTVWTFTWTPANLDPVYLE
jgi:hypothetical protein